MKEKTKLIGREKETASIDKLMHSGRAEFLAVYGRRRVGKTFLIRQYLKNNMVFDFTGTKDGAKEQQLIIFFEEYTKRAGNRKKKQVPLTWHEAFGYLASYLRQLPKRKIKHVVFIDEMPWIDTPKSEFISALEFLWNQHLSKMDNVLLIACGSASSWIKKKLIKSRGGLYNRVTHRIHLKPFNLYETELFLNNLGIKLSRYQLLEIYMAMGGIPFYLNEISKGKSAAQFIDSTCFVAGGLLHDEYSQLYHSLFKNADNHIHIIEALASWPQGMARTEIASKIKISEGSLSRAMEELIDCDLVSKYQPLIHKKKTSVYKLTDAYSLFYLKFIKTHKGSGKGTWEQLYKISSFKAWSGYAFENIWLAHPSQLRRALGISGVYTILSSWKFTGNDALPGAQIDMIIDRADNTIHLCEAKFTKENFAITKNYGEQLKLKKTIFKQATQTKKQSLPPC